ncbi:hypothetical protein ACFS5L_29165 [Streptomyces phyllanthi]|uniref:hypothetical protein n=1 Tax=Streptomyces phyllanthi TaxID=1803180 RepID=UPI00363AC30F
MTTHGARRTTHEVVEAAGGVPGEVGANAVKHQDGEQLAALVCLIAVVNARTRRNGAAVRPLSCALLGLSLPEPACARLTEGRQRSAAAGDPGRRRRPP